MENKDRNIFQRMTMIVSELGVVAKNLEIESSTKKYSAVGERDILDAVKPLEIKYGIFSYPVSREIVPMDEIKDKVYLRVKTVYRFVNIDNPTEYIDMTTYGDGIDTYDKAPGKAMTYADKYALIKAYKISTGDDPDQEPSPDDCQKVKKATKEQEEILRSLLPAENFAKMLEFAGANCVEDMPYDIADEYIKKVQKKKARKKKEEETKENN